MRIDCAFLETVAPCPSWRVAVGRACHPGVGMGRSHLFMRCQTSGLSPLREPHGMSGRRGLLLGISLSLAMVAIMPRDLPAQPSPVVAATNTELPVHPTQLCCRLNRRTAQAGKRNSRGRRNAQSQNRRQISPASRSEEQPTRTAEKHFQHVR